MATRALVFEMVGRDRSLGRTFDQMGRKSKELGRNFAKAGVDAQRATDRLKLGVDKANLALKQAEVTASRARESHARAARIFGRDSNQAYQAALRVTKAQHGVREASLGVADAQAAMSRRTNEAQQVSVRASARWGHFGVSLGRVAKAATVAGLALGGAAAIGAGRFVAAGVKAAASFDQTMRQFAQIADVPKAQLGDMRKLALDMGSATSFSASQAGQAMLDLAKGGLTAAQIKGGALQQTLTLAAAGGIELSVAGSTMATALNMFALRASDAGQVAAALAGGANASTASVESLSQALSQVGPGARNAGLSLQETVGVLAAFDQAGIKGSDAGTSLKTMLTSLVPQTDKARETMKKFGLEFVYANGRIKPITEIADELHTKLKGLSQAQRIAALQTIFGSDATRAATVLMNEGAQGLSKYITATWDLNAAQRLAKENTSGAAGAFEQLKGAIETISIKVGSVLLPPLAAAAKWLADKLPAGLDKAGSFFGRLWERIEPVRHALGRLWGAVREGAGQIGGALAAAFKAISPSAGEAQDRMGGFASFIRNTVIPAVKGFSRWAAEDGIPAFLDFADHYINDFAKPVGKATLAVAAIATRAFATIARAALAMGGQLLHSMAEAFGFVPGIGAKLKDADRRFQAFASGANRSMDGAADAMARTRDAGSRALDALGKQVGGARRRYEDFQKAARTPVLVKVSANITDLVNGFTSGKIRAAEFKAKANAEIAKITSKPARDKMQALISDLARGKIDITTFRAKWNAEMGRLRDASRIASVIARLRSAEVLKSDLNKAKHLIGLRAGGRIMHGTGPTADDVLVRASKGETVVSAADSARPEFQAWATERRIPGFAAGGRVFRVNSSGLAGLGDRLQRQTGMVDSFVAGVGRYVATLANQQLNKAWAQGLGGPGIRRALQFARSHMVGLPYVWGGAGPGGVDCSGAMSVLTNVVMGRSPWRRLFATGSFPTSGWVPGFVRAGFNIGSYRGRPGHMAGTLGGVNVEARGGRGFVMGSGARGALSPLFRGHVWHLVGRSGASGGREQTRAFHAGGVLPEDIWGVGRSGRTYSMQRGETVTPRAAGGDVHVHFHGDVYGDRRAIQDAVRKAVREMQRRVGGAAMVG